MSLSRWKLIIWALVFCFKAPSCQNVEVKSPIFARMGESADLPCTYKTSTSSGFTLEWWYAAPGTPAINAKRLLYFNGMLYWVGSEGRMALLQNPPVRGTATLRISTLQSSDTGLYICDITNPKDWSGSGRGLINLTVLVPPSVPVCGLNGQSYTGNDVTLTCQASHGFPTPIYSWSRGKNAAQLPVQNWMEDPRSGSLILSNLSAPFSGTYTCKASNELGYAVCTVTVRVASMGDAVVIGGAVMGTFIALLLIAAVLAYFFWYQRKQAKMTKERNTLSEDKPPPSFRPCRRGPDDSLLGSFRDGHGTSRPGHPKLKPGQQSFVV